MPNHVITLDQTINKQKKPRLKDPNTPDPNELKFYYVKKTKIPKYLHPKLFIFLLLRIFWLFNCSLKC